MVCVMSIKALKYKWHKDLIRDDVREEDMDEQRLHEKCQCVRIIQQGRRNNEDAKIHNQGNRRSGNR